MGKYKCKMLRFLTFESTIYLNHRLKPYVFDNWYLFVDVMHKISMNLTVIFIE